MREYKAIVNADVSTPFTGLRMDKGMKISVTPTFHGLYKITSPAEYKDEHITPDLITFEEVHPQ